MGNSGGTVVEAYPMPDNWSSMQNEFEQLPLESIRTIAIAMIEAGDMVIRLAQHESDNKSSAEALIKKFFGGDPALQKLDSLRDKFHRLCKQVRCNVTQVKLYTSDSKWETTTFQPGYDKNNCPAYTIRSGNNGKRVFWIGPAGCRLTELELAAIFVHETTHLCIDTKDHSYAIEDVLTFPFDTAVDNAQNFQFFCVSAFFSIHNSGLPVHRPVLENRGYTWRLGHEVVQRPFTHCPKYLHQGQNFATFVNGDRVGGKNARVWQHELAETWTVTSKSGNSFDLSMKSHTAGGITRKRFGDRVMSYTGDIKSAHCLLNDGTNTWYFKVLSANVSVGSCLCGGEGGRSFITMYGGCRPVDGAVAPKNDPDAARFDR